MAIKAIYSSVNQFVNSGDYDSNYPSYFGFKQFVIKSGSEDVSGTRIIGILYQQSNEDANELVIGEVQADGTIENLAHVVDGTPSFIRGVLDALSEICFVFSISSSDFSTLLGLLDPA